MNTPKRQRTPDRSAIEWSEVSLRLAVEHLKQAIRWRDISRQPRTSAAVRSAARFIMRDYALKSRASFAGQITYA